jgi:hypothetical protein
MVVNKTVIPLSMPKHSLSPDGILSKSRTQIYAINSDFNGVLKNKMKGG